MKNHVSFVSAVLCVVALLFLVGCPNGSDALDPTPTDRTLVIETCDNVNNILGSMAEGAGAGQNGAMQLLLNDLNITGVTVGYTDSPSPRYTLTPSASVLESTFKTSFNAYVAGDGDFESGSYTFENGHLVLNFVITP